MTYRGSPTARGRRLAAELRRLRERSGLTGEEVAERLGWSESKVSRLENYRIGVKPADLRRLLDLYRVGQPHRDELLALASESRQKTWLEMATAGIPPEQAVYLVPEAEARSVRSWEPQVVPGLLQTPEYARAVMLGWQTMFALPPDDTERRISVRLARQQLLTRDPPLKLSVVLDESVLRRRFGGNNVMRRQLERLAEASELPNVDLRVLELGGNHPIGTGAFYYLEFPQVHEVPMNDIVTVDHLLGSYHLEDEKDTRRFRVTFESLMAESLSPADSRELITRTAQLAWS